MTREKIISGLQMTMDLIQFDPVTGNVRPIYTLNDIDKTTYVACKAAIEALKAQEWVPVDKKSHPDTPKRVQVQLDNGWIITAYYQENEWLSVPDCGEPIEDRWIEAWKPMPEPYLKQERTMEEFMYGQDMGNPEDGSL